MKCPLVILVMGLHAVAGNSHSVESEDISINLPVMAKPTAPAPQANGTTAAAALQQRRSLLQRPPPEKLEVDRKARVQRQRARRERARQKIASVKPDFSSFETLTKEELIRAEEEDHPWVRRTGWRNNDADYETYSSGGMADPGTQYEKWQQAYRMLGGFIDCDHAKSEGNNQHSGDNDNNNEEEENNEACSRWMMWAAYVDPNYGGNGYDEYHGDGATGVLDCHSPDTEWKLLGVYRQEFYQFIEQISKHLWAIDDYEYVVSLSGLAYMTDYECFQVGADGNGNAIYAGVAPKSEGKFEMALYTDGYCLTPNEDLGITYDDYGLTSDLQLGSGDHGNDQDNEDGGGDNAQYDDDVYEWWENSQEYTLTQLNEVYESFKYCTSCVDYPTYQDGYFIGDYGTDDDDLINQCWKFYSHDSFTCEADCIALGHAQGTILNVNYGGVTWGEALSDFYSDTGEVESSSETSSSVSESQWSRMGANIFVAFSSIVFVATSLAFALARRSRNRERGGGRRRLLRDDHVRGTDGLLRPRSKSKSRAASQSRRSRSVSGRKNPEGGLTSYQPPSKLSKSGHRSRSRGRRDNV